MLTSLKTTAQVVLVCLLAGSGVWAQESGPWRLTNTSYKNGMTDKTVSASRLSTVDMKGSGCIMSVSNSGGKAFITVELHNDVISGNVVGVLMDYRVDDSKMVVGKDYWAAAAGASYSNGTMMYPPSVATSDKRLVKAMLAGKRLKLSRQIYNGALVMEFNIEGLGQRLPEIGLSK